MRTGFLFLVSKPPCMADTTTTATKTKSATPAPAPARTTGPAADPGKKQPGKDGKEVKKTGVATGPLVFVRPPAKQYVKPRKAPAKGVQEPVSRKQAPAKAAKPGKTGKSPTVKGKASAPKTGGKGKAAPAAKRNAPAPKTNEPAAGEFIDVKTPLQLLNAEYAVAQINLAGGTELRKGKVREAANRERKKVQQSVTTQSAAISKVYLDTISAVQKTPEQAKAQAIKPMMSAAKDIIADKVEMQGQTKATEIAINAKLFKGTLALIVAGTSFKENMVNDINRHASSTRGACHQSVFEIASWYKDKEEYPDVLEELGEMAVEYNEGVTENSSEAVSEITEDTTDLIDSFTGDTTDTVEKVKEAREKADESLTEMAQGGLGQLPEFIGSVITELRTQATSITMELLNAMSGAVKGINDQGSKAKAAIDEQERQTIQNLTTSFGLKKKLFSDMYADVMKQLPELPDTLAVDLIQDARNGIRNSMEEDRITSDNAVKETDTAMAGTATELNTQLTVNTMNTTNELTTFRVQFVTSAMTSVEGALQQMRGEIKKQYGEIVTKFQGEISDAVVTAMAKLQQKFTEATTDIVMKVAGTKGAITDSYNEQRKGMEKAAYKVVNDSFWDDVGDFFGGLISGILGFLGDVLLGILAIVVAVIAIVVAVAVLIAVVALLAYGLAALVTYGLAMLTAMMPFLLKGLAIFFFIDGAISLIKGVVLIYKALTTPGLSFKERMSMIGEGLLEIASVIPVGKVLKVFKLGGRFTKFTAKVASKVSNSRIGKAVVEFAEHNFDVAGVLINKLGNKLDDIVNRVLTGTLDKLSGIVLDKLLKGKWTGPLLRKAQAQYQKVAKYGDDALAVAKGQADDVAIRIAREKAEKEFAQRMAAHEAKELAEKEAKKKLAKEGKEEVIDKAKRRRRKPGKKEKEHDKDKKKKDKPDSYIARWKSSRDSIKVSKDEKHTLTSEKGMGKGYELFVYSSKTPYKDFVDAMVIDNRDIRKSLIARAKQLDLKMDSFDRLSSTTSVQKSKKLQADKDIMYMKSKLASETESALQQLPQAVLPLFYEGKAKSFEAKYINSKTPHGEESHKHKGNLLGWNELLNNSVQVGNKMESVRRAESFVKMHLLHARWGKATSSNLTPARTGYNSAFYADVESNAVKDVDQNNEVIWFNVTIAYHNRTSGPNPNIDYSHYPRHFAGSYGLMKRQNGKWASQAAKHKFSKPFNVPNFSGVSSKTFNLNADSPPTLLALDLGYAEGHRLHNLEDRFARKIYDLRYRVVGGQSTVVPYSTYNDFVIRMNDSYNRSDKGKYPNFKNNMEMIDEAKNQGKIKP